MPTERLRLKDLTRSSTFRLVVRLGVAWIVGVAALLGTIYHLTVHELVRRSDEMLERQMQHLMAQPATALPDAVRAMMASGGRAINYQALYDASGKGVVGNLDVTDRTPTKRPVERPAVSGYGPLRFIVARHAAGQTLVVARDAAVIEDLRQRLLVLFMLSGAVSAVGMPALALLASIRPLRRVRQLKRVARAIGVGRYGTRMPVDGRDDDIDDLAQTVNGMIDEVERLVGELRSSTDAVAHDLRAPLTRLKARLHHATARHDASSEVAMLATGAIEELDIVLGRFAALLRISAIEASEVARSTCIDLVPLIDEAVAFYEPLAFDAGVQLETRPVAGAVVADRALLFEALCNLIDNAIKFAASRVVIAVELTGGQIRLIIRDDGPGIPVEEREHVLRRFHRGAAARDVPGAGLGLSIVAAIAHHHRAWLSFEDAGPGLQVVIVFPRAAPGQD